MKMLLLIVMALVGIIVVAFVIMGVMSRLGEPVGLVEGKLSRCPAKPNCICSEYDDDQSHYTNPIKIKQSFDTLLPELKSTIQKMDGNIISEQDNYLAATFTSTLFGFVDDFEIRYEAEKQLLHIRSASRVGYSDSGVNIKRVNAFKDVMKNR